jgi:hypothetical protein
MGYYIRIFGTQDVDIHIEELLESLTVVGLSAKIEHDPSEQSDKWTMLDILNKDGEPLAQVERNPVVDGELGQEELDEFKEMIQEYKPDSAVKWLTNYFEKVKVIYAFQMLNAAFNDGNFEIIDTVKTKIWHKTKGISQADNEGFTNEEGYHILWQFADNVKGELSCAIRNWLGKWEKFEIDLSDIVQRLEFQNGKIPKYAKRL